MKVDLQTIQDTFKIGYEAFQDSRDEARKIVEMFHNRQYTQAQLAKLMARGQPAETFNVIKLFGRLILGYFGSVINTVTASPVQEDDIMTASVITDMLDYTFRENNFDDEGEKIKLDGLLVGLMASYTVVVPTGERDQFNRPHYKIEIQHVPASELVLDPMSRRNDYSDSRFLHRFKWLDDSTCIRLFGKEKVALLEAQYNHLNIPEADFAYLYNQEFTGYYKTFDNYLVVHTIITDDDQKTWSVFWCGDVELDRKEISYKKVKSYYRVQKVHTSDIPEYYGIFREVKETQKAINQALIKIQLMVNTQKAFVQDGAVDDIAEFTNQFNRVSAVIPVLDINGIKIENLTREVLDQYTIIDKALNRIQRVLSINDSFLGMAYASDAASKVKMQQTQSIIALSYFTNKVKQFYKLLGWDIMYLYQQYFTANQVFRIADNYEGNRWIELNKPLEIETGRVDPNTGMPIKRMVFEEVKDPETNKPLVDDNGFIIVAPIPTLESEIAFTKADIEVNSVAYNDETEKNQLMLDGFLNGGLGQMLSQVNPIGYFQAGALAVKNVKAKYSPEISDIINQTSQMMQGNQQAQAMTQQLGQQVLGGNQASQLPRGQ